MLAVGVVKQKDGGKIYNKTKRVTKLIVKASAYDKKMKFDGIYE